jgi:hypothetical protein
MLYERWRGYKMRSGFQKVWKQIDSSMDRTPENSISPGKMGMEPLLQEMSSWSGKRRESSVEIVELKRKGTRLIKSRDELRLGLAWGGHIR